MIDIFWNSLCSSFDIQIDNAPARSARARELEAYCRCEFSNSFLKELRHPPDGHGSTLKSFGSETPLQLYIFLSCLRRRSSWTNAFIDVSANRGTALLQFTLFIVILMSMVTWFISLHLIVLLVRSRDTPQHKWPLRSPGHVRLVTCWSWSWSPGHVRPFLLSVGVL